MMNLAFILLFCVFSVALCSPLEPSCGKGKSQFPGTRIIGGRPAKFGEFPWQVSIGRISAVTGGIRHFCGGTILSSNTILTAAHCLEDEIVSRLGIRYNTIHIYESQNDYVYVKEAIVHPKYDKNGFDYDIAILHLDKPLENASPICLPKKNDDPPVYSDVFVTGWGYLKENGKTSEDLMAVEIPVIDRTKCQEQLTDYYMKKLGYVPKSVKINQHMFCSGTTEGGKDSCQGDSGGPVISFDKDDTATIRGIVSWGVGCGRPRLAGVNALVGAFVDNFIQEHLI